MGETNSPSVAHVGYDISPLWRLVVKIFNLTLLSGEYRNLRATEGESIYTFTYTYILYG
jgi:hypothetical protein